MALEYNPKLLETYRCRKQMPEFISCCRTWGIVAGFLLATGLLTNAIPCAAQKSSPGKTPAASAASRAKSRADIARFRARVDTALTEVHAQKTYWGVVVADQDTGAILYELNADHFFAPASNAKIFTTALALASLPPSFRFRTTLESQGVLGADGRLGGDLRFVGRGDPDLSNRKFPYAGKVQHEGPTEKVLAEMIDEAVAKGLKEVDGDIVADDSYFPYDPYPAGWSVGDLFFTFGAPVSAIAFNDNSISIDVLPALVAGEPAAVTVSPGYALNPFGQEITTGPGDAKPDFAVVRRPGTGFQLLRGSIPLGHASMKIDLAMLDPAEIVASTLKQLLEERGVHVTGTTRVRHAPPPDTSDAGDLPPPPEAALYSATLTFLAEHFSQPLIESVRVTNKVSQNLHAELLLRTVARERTGVGSSGAGLKLEKDFLAGAGIADGDVGLADGSGLSGSDLVTPRAVIEILRYAAEQPWGSDFMSTFPIAGVDGTLETRMKGTAAEGIIHAKTGGLEHAHALSGYATTQRGEHLVFSIFGNNNTQKGRDATIAIDAIGVAMVETLGAQAPAKKKK
jgi:D-alanyl-D-alanine carboxypeptidase/D-alanyl-D-alanine-endopeptidase (penicillin-binding protein 4)